jgi:hypothetical protein
MTVSCLPLGDAKSGKPPLYVRAARGPPEYGMQRIPAATPHVGHETDKLVSSERETAPVRLGSPRNQAVFGSRRKEKANPAVLPHYADPFRFILFYVNSSHSPRLFPLVLNVIPNFRSFATGVWHKLLRADKRATVTTPKSPVFKVKRRWGHSGFPAYVHRGPLEWTKARLSSMSCTSQGEVGRSHGELPSQSRYL